MWQDKLNGVFELAGGVFVFLNCLRLYRDKTVKGVSFTAFVFFTLWGFWNLYYYPAIGQWASFLGGCHVVFWNVVWVILAIYYIKRGTK
jgi:hypothetical protein